MCFFLDNVERYEPDIICLRSFYRHYILILSHVWLPVGYGTLITLIKTGRLKKKKVKNNVFLWFSNHSIFLHFPVEQPILLLIYYHSRHTIDNNSNYSKHKLVVSRMYHVRFSPYYCSLSATRCLIRVWISMNNYVAIIRWRIKLKIW